MIWNLFSFFLNNEEAFIELNPNILETNVINIVILIGLLFYAYKTSFGAGFEIRQKEIIQTIENAQKDVISASNYSEVAEKGFSQSLFWLQSWKSVYQKEKLQLVTTKYNLVKTGIAESFFTAENLIQNFEKKSFISLKRYIILLTASKILRKFLLLSEQEQLKLIELTISKIGGTTK
jgi:F0F1-type ATP synthase membrane subunit b/b'